ncbi:hypothetical protein BJV78DRAFT_1159464, partial [Lactifluus subvellereus]
SSLRDPSGETWSEKYSAQPDLGFTGPLAFSHLPYARCLQDVPPAFDIALLGMPFDTAVAYRPGARFGPTGIRIGSRHIHREVPLSPFDNALALDHMQVAYSTLLQRDVARANPEGMVGSTRRFAKDNKEHPKIVTLGGDHTIVLPILRSLNKVYGPISVLLRRTSRFVGTGVGINEVIRRIRDSPVYLSLDTTLLTQAWHWQVSALYTTWTLHSPS